LFTILIPIILFRWCFIFYL